MTFRGLVDSDRRSWSISLDPPKMRDKSWTIPFLSARRPNLAYSMLRRFTPSIGPYLVAQFTTSDRGLVSKPRIEREATGAEGVRRDLASDNASLREVSASHWAMNRFQATRNLFIFPLARAPFPVTCVTRERCKTAHRSHTEAR